jgi:DHA1 family inner membrane transport protein
LSESNAILRFGPRRVVGLALLPGTALIAGVPLLEAPLPGALAMVALWGVIGWMINVPQQARLLAAVPEAGPILLGLHQSAVYFGIATSGLTGAAGLAVAGVAGLGYAALAMGALAAVALVISLRAERATAHDEHAPELVAA